MTCTTQIVKLRPTWHSEDDDAGVLKIVMTGSAADGPEWQQHIRDKRRREALGKRFKNARDPFKIVIVRDMWLTGFDVPSSAHDVRGQAHARPWTDAGHRPGESRLQGQARRVGGGLSGHRAGTEAGSGDLYGERRAGRTALPQEEAVAVMLEKYEVCRGLFHGFDWSAWVTGTSAQKGSALLPNAQEHILKQEDGKERLMKAVTELSKAFALAVPHEEAMRIRDDVGFFQAVRACWRSQRRSSTVLSMNWTTPSGRSCPEPFLQTRS